MKIFFIILMAALFVGCAAPTPEPVSPTDPAQPINVQTGETFTIIVQSNPSTGYHWEIVGNLSGVEFVSRDYKADEPVLAGSGGVDVWTFKAVAAGETQITLGSYPPGVDTTSPAENTTTFNINVK